MILIWERNGEMTIEVALNVKKWSHRAVFRQWAD
jgi:hypothetical protein